MYYNIMIEKRNRPRKIDLVGRVFTRLTCIEYIGKSEKGYQLYKCVCQCGNHYVARYSALTSGNTKSCGCLMVESKKVNNLKHGLRKSYYYTLWANIKQRCFNPTRPDYPFYGGKGVKMFEPWINDFKTFYQDLTAAIGEKPSDNLTLDRINYNGNYEVSNLRWVDRSIQCFNRKFKKSSASGYRGIVKEKDKFKAMIHKNNKRIVKVFDSLEEAQVFYKEKCLELYGELPPEYR